MWKNCWLWAGEELLEDSMSSCWIVAKDHKVDAEPLPIGKMYVLGTVDAERGKKHVQQSQYYIQIIKCTNFNYCQKLQTN